MPVCQNCFHKWTWLQTIRRLFSLRCPTCQEKQYESTASKQRNGIYGGIFSFIIFFIISFTDFSMVSAITIALLSGIAIFACYPFTLKLSNEKESLF